MTYSVLKGNSNAKKGNEQMLFSKEMEGRGILRFTQADQRVVYCLNDLCHLLGIKYSNKIRGELHNKYVYFLTVKENGKLIR